MKGVSTIHRMGGGLLLLVILLTPFIMLWLGKPFWLDIFTRLVILAIAASSLSLLLSVAGLASFGHAAYIGLGAYAVGIPVYYETYGGAPWLASYSGWWHLLLGVSVCALFALVTGAISLRTKGVHFIMITMAFSQMILYLLVGLEEFGGDDGLSVDLRSDFSLPDLSLPSAESFGFPSLNLPSLNLPPVNLPPVSLPPVSLEEPWVFYLVCFALLLLVLFIVSKVKHSHFGRVLQAARQNEQRVRALGINPYRYRLLVFVVAGVFAGLSGFLFANYAYFVSPSMVEWTRSGELMFMVILGGVSSLLGPVVGASVFVLLEHFLSRLTVFWHLPFGLLLLMVVLFGRGGIIGMLKRDSQQ